MKKLFRKIKRCNRDIEDHAAQIASIETMPYYSIFDNEDEREKDLNTCYEVMRMTLAEKQAHLETLQLEINKELNRVSQDQKAFTLLKHEN